MTSLSSFATRPKSKGFALVLALTLMSFIFLLTVSLALFVQIETSASTQQQLQEQARQNALYGLSVAIGEIQRLAGPDQRITAHATILNSSSTKNPYWVGVWDATQPLDKTNAQSKANAVLSWLVSGNQGLGPSDSGFLSALDTDVKGQQDSVTLVGKGSLGTDSDAENSYVYARKQKINSTPTQDGATGHFAYWVGDEGTKAKFNLMVIEESSEVSEGNQTSLEFNLAQLTYPSKITPEILEEWVGSSVAPSELAKLVSRDQLDLLNGQSDTFRKKHFHSLTPYSFGVLSNVRDGGLKQDLTAFLQFGDQGAELNQPGINANDVLGHKDSKFGLLRSWYALKDNASGFSPQLDVRQQTSESVGIYPVLTRIQIHTTFSLYSNGGGYALRIHLYPVISLWNPYNATLKAEDLEIQLKYFPAFEIQIADPNGTWSDTIDIKSVLSNPLRLAIENTTFEPGEVLVFYPQNSVPYSPAIDNSTPYSSLPILATSNGTADDNFYIDTSINVDLGTSGINPTGATIAIRRIEAADSNDQTLDVVLAKDGDILQQITNYLEWNTHGNFVAGRSLLVDEIIPANHVDYNLPHSGMTFVRYLVGNVPNNHSLRYMTGNVRARDTIRTQTELNNSGDASHPEWGLLQELSGNTLDPDGFEIHLDPSSPSGKTRTYAGFSHRDEGQGSFYILYETPRENQPLISLGMLQHAPLSLYSHHAGYAVGNSLADPRVSRDNTKEDDDRVDLSYLVNEALWDRFFLSGITDANNLNAEHPSPNARLRWAPDSRHDLSGISDFNRNALRFWVDGAFNVNSTEVESWVALLSAFRDLELESADGGNPDASLSNPFPRMLYPHAQAVSQNDLSGSNDPSVYSAFRSLTDEQLVALAEKIVEQVRRRGPFLSLSEFVNRTLKNDDTGLKGALQAAIDNTDINDELDDVVSPNVNWSDYESPHAEGSRATLLPGYLSQADILSAIGSLINVRSDTFIVRSYGDVVNPLNPNEIVAKAVCEAVVQRVPDPAIANDDPLNPEDSMGRGFRITSFRWLEPNEI